MKPERDMKFRVIEMCFKNFRVFEKTLDKNIKIEIRMPQVMYEIAV
jgi:hypothetical protein